MDERAEHVAELERRCRRKTRPVRMVDSEAIYSSAAAMADALGVSSVTIHNKIKGGEVVYVGERQ